MQGLHILFLLLCLLYGTAFGGLASDYNLDWTERVCSNVVCKAGEECKSVYENQEFKGKCKCKSYCPGHQNPVCGSDGITYPNHCDLHRTACFLKRKIKIEKKGPCLQEVDHSIHHPHARVQKSKPVVCYEHNRNELRDRLIAWVNEKSMFLNITLRQSQDIFKTFFEAVDNDKNGKLNSKEFMQLIRLNESVAKMPGEDEYINPILQGLCSDALMAITDEDSDWELSLQEFKRCLDPAFKPPHKLCELEGNMYGDGAEIPTDCNSCVCACGNWVCTALNCDDTDERSKNRVENQFVLDGKAAKSKLKKEITRHEVRVKKEGSQGEETILMLLKPKKRSKSKN